MLRFPFFNSRYIDFYLKAHLTDDTDYFSLITLSCLNIYLYIFKDSMHIAYYRQPQFK